MTLLILSFAAGIMTVAAPCVLPLLPVIIGGSLIEAGKDKPARQWLRPVIIAVSLAVSVVVFTLLIKATTLLLGVPQTAWQIIAGGIIALLGLNYLVPPIWEKLAGKGSFLIRSNRLLGKAYQHKGATSSLLIGAALGPVFNSCSPTYALIVAVILPAAFIEGLVYLIAYALGMSSTLLLIAFLGQSFVVRLRWLANPNSWLKRLIGVLFLLVGLSVIFGLDKSLQSYVLEQGWYDPIGRFEEQLRR